MSEIKTSHFRWNRRIEFAETDAAGIAHFSTFLIVMEQAEHALFRSLGLSVFSQLDVVIGSTAWPGSPASIEAIGDASNLILTWPRVRCECEYFSPARFEDELIVEIWIGRLGTKSMTLSHQIWRDKTLLARGKMVTVCSIKNRTTGQLVGCPIPQGLRDSFARWHDPEPDTPLN
jgi:acyl-CoA thioester hydrolase